MTDGERNLRVVIVEDSPTDAELVARELKRGGDPIEVERVDSASALRAALERGPCDLVISDYNLPGFGGPQALQVVKSYSADIPFILVSGTVGEEIAVQTLKSGADDYLLKGNLTRLAASVKAQLQEAEGRRARRRSEQALRRAQAMARLGHVITRADGSFESWSETLPQLIGVDSAGMPQSTREWLNIVHPDDKQKFREKAIETGATGERFDLEYRLRRADGAWIDVRQVSEPMQGEPHAEGGVRWFGTLQDITEQKAAEAKIRRLNRVYAVLSGINVLIVRERDREQLFREACRIAVEAGKLRFVWIGVVDEEAMQLTPVAWAGEDQDFLAAVRSRLSLSERDSQARSLVAQAVVAKEALISNDVAKDPRIRFKQEHAQRGIRSLAAFPLMLSDKVVGVVALHAAEVGFFDHEEVRLLTELVGDISFGLEHIDKEQKLERLNRVYAVLSGINTMIVRVRDRDELFREACRIAIELGRFRLVYVALVDDAAQQIVPVAWAGDHPDLAQRPRPLGPSGPGREGTGSQAIRSKRPVVENNITADSRTLTYPEEVLKRGYRSVGSFPLVVGEKAVGVLGLFANEPGYFDAQEIRLLQELAGDIAFALEHIEKTERLDYLAYYDSLTGLANRTLFVERVTESLHSTSHTPLRVALIVADIERFRTINDSLGRQAGDLLLKQAAGRLRSNVPVPTHVARLGADHFAILLPEARAESDVARWLRQLTRACLGEPFRIGDTELRISAKAGIALSPVEGGDADTLLKQAEAALQNAKRTGEPYLFYEQTMTDRVAGALALENQLRLAVEREEFVLHYQPKVDLASRRIVGMEALIRWQSPELGLVPPMKFIPLLEETGLILPVGAWAMRKAARDHRELLRQGLAAPRVAVNVSAVQLRRRDFVETVKRAIEDAASPPAIDLEITESLVMEGIAENIQKLNAVRDLGLQIAIDDFGTGYSSLAYLAKLPVHALKIDRSFIITMLEDPNTTTLVSTIISLAHSLKLKVVAEGVDSEEQAKVLRLLRCDEMQGYLFSKPLPLDALVELLRKAS